MPSGLAFTSNEAFTAVEMSIFVHVIAIVVAEIMPRRTDLRSTIVVGYLQIGPSFCC
jgi:hypothetical protein